MKPTTADPTSVPTYASATRLLLLIVPLTVGGCANTTRNVTSSAEHHRMKKRPGANADAHAITYDSRGRGAYIKPGSEFVKLCAEPPPDASANLQAESEFTAKLAAAAEYEAIKATFDGDIDRSQSASSTVTDVATRTELVLFMRDAMYRICEMHFNGVIDGEKAESLFSEVVSAARVLGQRDNVAKLVDLAKAMMATEKPDAALIHDVIGTIRFLAASDYLLASDQAENLGAVLLTQVLGNGNIESARSLMENQLRFRLNQITKKKEEEKAAKGNEKKKIAAEVKVLEEEQRASETIFEEAFAPLPPELKLDSITPPSP